MGSLSVFFEFLSEKMLMADGSVMSNPFRYPSPSGLVMLVLISLASYFSRFRHMVLGCYLRAANVVLPQWGFKQIEVSCSKDSKKGDMHSYWNVESHWNERCE
jgi:hypothetical protein